MYFGLKWLWKKLDKDTTARFALILSLLSLTVTSFFTLQSINLANESNRLNREAIEFQNMLQNWTAVMDVSSQHANLLTSVSSDNRDVETTTHTGYLNLSVEIVSPHYCNLSVKILDFEVTESYNFVLPGTRNTTSVTLVDPEKYDDLDAYNKGVIPPGYSSFEVNIFLKTEIHPDVSQFPSPEDVSRYPSGLTQQYSFGEITFELELADIQTGEIIVREISERIHVSVHVY